MFLSLKKPQLLVLLVLLSTLGSCSHERTNSDLKTTRSVSGTVVKISDGDTITILDSQKVQHKIRLQGIDAPERKQDFSDVSREHLASLVFGKYVTVEYEKIDRYGRLVGKVWVDDNDECLEQLNAGLAWHYKEYEQEQSPADRQSYSSAEREARSRKLGLWKDPTPIPPWEYRHHTNRSTVETDFPKGPTSGGQSTSSTSRKIETNPQNPTLLTDRSPKIAEPGVAHSDLRLRKLQRNSRELGLFRGNKNSMIYHWPGCPNYDEVALHNRVPFMTREEAEKAGYRAARNCR